MGIEDFYFVRDVTKAESNVAIGMNRLLDYCEKKSSDSVWKTIRSLDFKSEIPKLRLWLEDVLSSELPSDEINVFWFGLFNPILDNGESSCGLYISGSTKFDPHDETGNWATWQDDSYFPEKRYAKSKILHEMYHLVSENANVSNFAEYILALGYSCFVVKDLCHSINLKLLLGDRKRRDVAVGFDSGDFIILEGIEG